MCAVLNFTSYLFTPNIFYLVLFGDFFFTLAKIFLYFFKCIYSACFKFWCICSNTSAQWDTLCSLFIYLISPWIFQSLWLMSFSSSSLPYLFHLLIVPLFCNMRSQYIGPKTRDRVCSSEFKGKRGYSCLPPWRVPSTMGLLLIPRGCWPSVRQQLWLSKFHLWIFREWQRR